MAHLSLFVFSHRVCFAKKMKKIKKKKEKKRTASALGRLNSLLDAQFRF